MMKAVMKERSDELATLSHEHRHGLEFADRIRRGLQHKVSSELLKDYFFWYWRNHIKPHFRHEEDILLPFFPPGNKLAQRMRNEHDMIRELMLCLDEEADTRTLTLIADLIEDHISFEEKDMYTWLEKELTEDQLKLIRKMLEEKPIQNHEPWTNEFWKSFKNGMPVK
jgi:hypothetical protein